MRRGLSGRLSCRVSAAVAHVSRCACATVECSPAAIESALRAQLMAQRTSSTGVPRRVLEAEVCKSVPGASPTTCAAALEAAWLVLSTSHYRVGDDATDCTVYACDWPRVMHTVAASELPYEGLREQEFVSCLRTHCPALPNANSLTTALVGADGVAGWVRTHFAHLIHVTRSAVTGAPLYHAVNRHGVERSTTLREEEQTALDAVRHSLRLLHAGTDVPVWHDVRHVTALLAPHVCPSEHTWESFLLQPHLRAYVELRAEVQVRSRRLAIPCWVVLDATSLPVTACDTLMARHAVTADRCGAVKVLLREGQARPTRTWAAAADYVVVGKLFEPEHVCAALLATRPRLAGDGAAEPGLRVVVLCADNRRAAFENVLRDVRQQRGLRLELHSPTESS